MGKNVVKDYDNNVVGVNVIRVNVIGVNTIIIAWGIT